MSAGNRKTILVVEDDRALRTFYRTTLTVAGYAVLTAGDGIEALHQLESHIPDLVVLDMGLPLLSGHDVRREIAAHASTQHIPVMVVTGESLPIDPSEFACVMRKPVEPDAFLAKVEDCLRKSHKT